MRNHGKEPDAAEIWSRASPPRRGRLGAKLMSVPIDSHQLFTAKPYQAGTKFASDYRSIV